MKIAFYRGTSIMDHTILFVSRGGYSHVCIVLDDESIIEAYPFKGVRTRKNVMDKMDRKKVDIFDVPTTPEQDIIIKNFLAKQLGKGYDYWAIVGFLIHTTEDGRRAYARWICSELVFAAFRKAGIDLLKRIEAWKVSPTILSYNTIMSQ